MLCLRSRNYYYSNVFNELKFSSEGLNKRVLDLSGDRFLEKYRKILDHAVNNISTNRSFRANDHTVGAYEQI